MQQDGPSDLQLVSEVRGGSQRAFERLVERHQGVVFAIAYSRLRDRDAAEDLAQEVFLRTYLGLETLREGQRYGAWVCQMARNLAMDWVRRGEVRSRLVRQVPLDAEGEQVADRERMTTRERIMAEDEKKLLDEALWSLPEAERELVLLHYMEGLDKKEIAARLGVHPSTVGRQMDKALDKMRERMLQDTIAPLRPTKRLTSRTVAVVAAVAALSAESRASLAAQAAQTAVECSAPAVSFPVLLQTKAAYMVAGVAAMGTGGKMIATSFFVAAIAAGSLVYTGVIPTATHSKATAEMAAARRGPVTEGSLVIGEPSIGYLKKGETMRIQWPKDNPMGVKETYIVLTDDGKFQFETHGPEGRVYVGASSVRPEGFGAEIGGDPAMPEYFEFFYWKPDQNGAKFYFHNVVDKTLGEERARLRREYEAGRISNRQMAQGTRKKLDQLSFLPKDPEARQAYLAIIEASLAQQR